MNILGNAYSFRELYPDDFLPDILGGIIAAWGRVHKPLDVVHEVLITKKLTHEFRLEPRIRELPFRVVRELPIDDPETGEERGRIDIGLLNGHDDDSYFAFECKRLNVTFPSGKFERLAGKYVGDDGMGCYLSGKYGAGHRHGGMIGYVLDGKVAAARRAVSERIRKEHQSLRMRSKRGLEKSSVDSSNSQLGATTHFLDGRKLRIHHVFLPA